MAGSNKKIRTVLIGVILAALLAGITDRLYYSDIEWRFRTSRLNKVLTEKEIEAATLIHNIERELAAGHDIPYLIRNKKIGTTHRNDLILLIYHNDKIGFWSDNSVSFPEKYVEYLESHEPVFISNGWFLPVHGSYGSYKIVTLIGVYRQYPISNNLLHSGFPDDYGLPEGAVITFNKNASGFIITGVEGNYHFGVVFPEIKPNTVPIIIPVLFWLILLLLWVYLTGLITTWLVARSGRFVALAAGNFLLLLFYFVVIISGTPPSVESTELFSPFIISAGSAFPSLGHLLLLSFLLVAVMYNSIRNSPLHVLESSCNTRQLVRPALLAVTAFSFFILAESMFRSIITRSTLTFEAYKILDVTLMSLIGFLAVLLFLAVPVVMFIRLFRMIQAIPLHRKLLIVAAGFMMIPVALIAGVKCSLWGIVYILLLALVLMAWVKSSSSLLTIMVVYAALTGIYSTAVIIRFSDIRDNENLKVLAVSLASDNDMIAESMLIDIWPLMRSDTTLTQLMNREDFSPADNNAVYRYLQTKYFTGYLGESNYDLSIVICRDDSQLQIPDQASYASNCFFFFEERIKAEGDSITGTGVWFMHNQAGRAYYLSRLFYNFSPFLTNGLFIELVSHIETYQAGYPELLINGTSKRFPGLKDISYAKYSGGNLVMRSGNYSYDNKILPANKRGGEYQITRANGYKHMFYNRGDMTLVITRQMVSSLNAVVTFAYLFITITVFSFLLLMAFSRSDVRLGISSFRRRLQLAFAGVLTVVFVVIIVASVFLIIAQFKGNHTRFLMEKVTSVSIEMEHKFASETSILPSWSNSEYLSPDELLVKFSNVFLTDINLYNPEGHLIASSRPEVFSEKLEGTMIDPKAYNAMAYDGKQEFLQEERIGELKYLSAYVPFYNEDNKLLVYINLPYFSMQNILTGEISNMVVTIINFTLLLMMIMMWLSVFLSERITSPMTLLQRAMASVEYGKKNEYIHYDSRDEVGEIVRQYNRMIDELDESAGKLARSEREMAWREMARQIAHEIKNPLTPMKLNVQQLFKWWKDKVPDFPRKIEKFTDNQIEYIDNLSSIASAFSYFARLPGAEPAEVDVLTQLSATIEMFGHTEEATINLDSGNISKAVIMADKEHLNGIFSNLIKNAIQAMPAGMKGIINVTLSASFDKLLVTVSDNGVGIPEELKTRMFTPNFTTKSSGMGLGLSIVKRYVETAGGNIWFESERGKGTTFFIELPLLYTVERLGNHES